MTLGELKESLAQIHAGHHNKPVVIFNSDGKIIHLDNIIAVQGDRIMIDSKRLKRKVS